MAAWAVGHGASGISRPKSRPLRENLITRKGRHRPSLRLAPRRRYTSRSRRKLCRCLRKPCLKARAHKMDGGGEWAIKDKKKPKKMKQKKSFLAPPKPHAGLQRGQPRWLCAQRAATYPLRGRQTSRRRLRTLLQLKRRRLLRRRRGPKAARRRCRPGGLPPQRAVAEPLVAEARVSATTFCPESSTLASTIRCPQERKGSSSTHAHPRAPAPTSSRILPLLLNESWGNSYRTLEFNQTKTIAATSLLPFS